jgi:hypothetical protein
MERFWSKVDIGDWQDCWLWTAGAGGGYGKFTLGSRTDGTMRSERAHRVAYELLVGPVPEGLELDHVRDWGCTSTLCVNPLHLEPVTHVENVRRGDAVTHQSRKSHCKHGHAFDEANTYRYGNNWRGCRLCRKMAVRAYAQRRRAER